MQGPARIHAEPTVREGGTIQLRVDGDVSQLTLVVPGVGVVKLGVVQGRAEYTLPPQVHGGGRIIVSDMQVPDPSSIGIDVIGAQSR